MANYWHPHQPGADAHHPPADGHGRPTGHSYPDTGNYAHQWPQQPHPGEVHPASGMPVHSQPVTGPPHAHGAPPPPRKSRKLLYSLLSMCVILALGFVGSAYYFFLSRDSPEEVVDEYLTAASTQDFAEARTYVCDDASQFLTFASADSLEADSNRRLTEGMTWVVRGAEVDGNEATVTVERHIDPAYLADPSLEHNRVEYTLERHSRDWLLCKMQIGAILENGQISVSECADLDAWPVEPVDCTQEGLIYEVVDDVESRSDCPGDKEPFFETEDRRVLCLLPAE